MNDVKFFEEQQRQKSYVLNPGYSRPGEFRHFRYEIFAKDLRTRLKALQRYLGVLTTEKASMRYVGETRVYPSGLIGDCEFLLSSARRERNSEQKIARIQGKLNVLMQERGALERMIEETERQIAEQKIKEFESPKRRRYLLRRIRKDASGRVTHVGNRPVEAKDRTWIFSDSGEDVNEMLRAEKLRELPAPL